MFSSWDFWDGCFTVINKYIIMNCIIVLLNILTDLLSLIADQPLSVVLHLCPSPRNACFRSTTSVYWCLHWCTCCGWLEMHTGKFGSRRWKTTPVYLSVSVSLQVWTTTCGDCFDPQLVRCSSEWVSADNTTLWVPNADNTIKINVTKTVQIVSGFQIYQHQRSRLLKSVAWKTLLWHRTWLTG